MTDSARATSSPMPRSTAASTNETRASSATSTRPLCMKCRSVANVLGSISGTVSVLPAVAHDPVRSTSKYLEPADSTQLCARNVLRVRARATSKTSFASCPNRPPPSR
eukprot:3828772-Prymnesium_polylepis.1